VLNYQLLSLNLVKNLVKKAQEFNSSALKTKGQNLALSKMASLY
jgi:hypothetical protein